MEPRGWPDLGITPEIAETILTTDDVQHHPVEFPGFGLGEGGQEYVNFVKQALTVIAHGGNCNTNPWNGPNVWTIRIADIGVLVTSEYNPGPSPS